MRKTLLTGIAALFQNYTQVILTVIAIALVVFVWEQHTTRFAFWFSHLDNSLEYLIGIHNRLEELVIKECR